MNDTDEMREEGPLARNVPPTIPAHPRPGSRTIVATTAEYGRWRLSRVGLDLDDAIEEESSDYRLGLGDRVGAEAIAYAEQQPDIALWEGGRCLAVIRPRAGGDPEVTRFDGEDDRRPLPLPSTDAERSVWKLVKDHGAEVCRSAIVEKVYPRPDSSTYKNLSRAEQIAVGVVRNLGEQEAMDRLLFIGVYGAVKNVMDRLGSDAVVELRRIIEAGKAPVEVSAATVIGLEPVPQVAKEALP